MNLLSILLFIQTLYGAILEVNPDHSRIGFEIDYMTFSRQEGVFLDYRGYVDFDPVAVKMNSLEAQIKATSVDTKDRKRDAHLRKRDFFYVEKFPYINLKSVQVLSSGPKKFNVAGELEIRGIKKNVNLLVMYLGEKKDHVGKVSYFFEAQGEINRKDFGINWNKVLDQNELMLGDSVRLKINIQAQPVGRKTPFSAHLIPDIPSLKAPTSSKTEDAVLKNASVVLRQSNTPKNLPLEKKMESKENSLSWVKIGIGLFAFFFLVGLSFGVKWVGTKFSHQEEYSETRLSALIADGVVIILTLIYAIWFYWYLDF
jgi:polyisoprenoid-binding protein YceI